ncbi:MAG: hypothetical protein ACJ77L_13645 [Solirubrobacteraceae bacterium]|jgi:hypothetical protein
MRPILAGVSRRASEKRIFLGVVTALVTAALAAPALADNGAEKVHFFTHPNFTCVRATPAGTPSTSFALIKRDGDGRVSAEVALRDLEPNTTYGIWFFEVGGSNPSGCAGADIYEARTNNQGNENRHVEQARNINAASVAIAPPGSGPVLQTPAVTFGP